MLRQLTIQTSGGLPVFHMSVGDRGKQIEPMLFSSFTTALMMFTREMGTELTGIHLGGVEFFFQKIGEDDLVAIIGVEGDDEHAVVSTILKELQENEDLIRIFKTIARKQVVDPHDADTCKEMIIQLLAVHALLPTDSPEITARDAKDIQLIEAVTKELRQKKTSPRRLAEKVFNEGLQNADPQLIASTMTILREFVDSSQLERNLKKKMAEFLKYLDHFMKMSRMLGFTAE